MRNPWLTELSRSAFIVTASGITGYVFDYFLQGIIVGLLICLLILYRQILQYRQWLNKDRLEDYAEDEGILDDMYYRTLYLQKRHREKSSQLEYVIRRFQETARALPDGVIILNANNEVEWINKAARTLVGLKRKKDTGQIITNLIRNPIFIRYLMREDFKYPIEFPSPINEHIQISAQVIPYGREMRLLVIHDVTQLHNLEQMRQEFIASASHELRTPLTVITGYLESIQNLKDEDIDVIIKTMLEQSQRMESIISDMLTLARLESLKNHRDRSRKPVNIAAMIDSVIEDARSLSGGKHEFIIHTDQKLNLRGIEKDLFSAFSNLIHNAVRYTPEGSKIEINWYARQGVAYFTVEDDGPGIAAEHLPRLTERFYRVDVGRSRDVGGTGLGLAIVHQIMKHHDGQLLIASTPGKGSQFTCEFPAHLIFNQKPPQLQVIG